jgi:hypothetical protein
MGRYIQTLGLLGILLTCFTSHLAHAFVPTITGSGVPIRWKGAVKLNFAGNLQNQSGLKEDQFFKAAVQGLQRWQFASGSQITFDYWQGSDNSVYVPNSEYNGLSSLYFASNATQDLKLSPNVLGMTQVWYDTDSGEILETDIVLNDRDFQFTNNPTDTSGYGSGASTFVQGRTNVYIQNVITHELGHALGLSHSGGLQSTMLFMESPEQAHLGCDELIATHAIYPNSDHSSRGTITGQVFTENQKPLFGAHIVAISQARGTVLSTSITNQNGEYTLNSLEPGGYYLMAEPFYAGAQALPAYYAGSTPSICGEGTSFSRSFLTQADGFQLLPVYVGASKTASAPTLIAHCNNDGGAAVSNSISMNTAASRYPAIPVPADRSEYFGIIDQLNGPEVHYYRLIGISGHLAIHAISYSLYSPIQSSIALLTHEGNPISTHTVDPVYRGESGYTNYDSALVAENLPPGDYLLRITSKRMQANDYPAGPIALDSVPFLVITGSQSMTDPVLSAILPNNARCRMTENFPLYSSPPGNPPRSKTYTDSSEGGFCSTVRNIDENDSNSPPTPPSAIIAWFLPWTAMFLGGKIWIRLQRRYGKAILKV